MPSNTDQRSVHHTTCCADALGHFNIWLYNFCVYHLEKDSLIAASQTTEIMHSIDKKKHNFSLRALSYRTLTVERRTAFKLHLEP